MTIPPSEDPNFSNHHHDDLPGHRVDPSPRKKIDPRITLKKPPKSEDVFGFAKENTKDTIGYVFLIVGFLLLFFEPIYGGVILGALFGLYFTAELVNLWRNSQDWLESWGMVKTLVLAGILLSFFVSAIGPAIIITATAVTVVLKQLFLPDLIATIHRHTDDDKKS